MLDTYRLDFLFHLAMQEIENVSLYVYSNSKTEKDMSVETYVRL